MYNFAKTSIDFKVLEFFQNKVLVEVEFQIS